MTRPCLSVTETRMRKHSAQPSVHMRSEGYSNWYVYGCEAAHERYIPTKFKMAIFLGRLHMEKANMHNRTSLPRPSGSGRSKPSAIMHILACFHGISLERSRV